MKLVYTMFGRGYGRVTASLDPGQLFLLPSYIHEIYSEHDRNSLTFKGAEAIYVQRYNTDIARINQLFHLVSLMAPCTSRKCYACYKDTISTDLLILIYSLLFDPRYD
jgi:hypothetical protein